MLREKVGTGSEECRHLGGGRRNGEEEEGGAGREVGMESRLEVLLRGKQGGREASSC